MSDPGADGPIPTEGELVRMIKDEAEAHAIGQQERYAELQSYSEALTAFGDMLIRRARQIQRRKWVDAILLMVCVAINLGSAAWSLTR